MNDLQAAKKDIVRVLLVDDQRLLREGLRILLELHGDLRVVGEASDGIEAERQVDLLNPQVVLMDLRMPRRDGVAATRCITEKRRDVSILVLTTFDDDELVFRALDAGAAGYLLKDIGADALAEAIRATVRGDSPLQPSVARKIVSRLRGTAPVACTARPLPAAETLTAREIEILGLVGQGATNRQIATQLSLSEGTVKNYISAIIAKTGVHDRTQLALFAVRHGVTR
jgi:DNA-binding NarL/FixJ family response regulator